MSATGPGKPYSKRPAGSTGAFLAKPVAALVVVGTPVMVWLKTCETGTGAGALGGCIAVVEIAVVVTVLISGFLSEERREYIAAVAAAPAPALTAAITAKVAFDIATCSRVVGAVLLI
jgi:hypothetical protein